VIERLVVLMSERIDVGSRAGEGSEAGGCGRRAGESNSDRSGSSYSEKSRQEW
jgi:hypothetical protein